MILDNLIVEQVIGLVDVAEHNAAFLSVSVLTTAPAISQDSSIAPHRSPGILRRHHGQARPELAKTTRRSMATNRGWPSRTPIVTHSHLNSIARQRLPAHEGVTPGYRAYPVSRAVQPDAAGERGT
jgi:hypothetical protein